jgi:F-box/WD-40 domain protein 7
MLENLCYVICVEILSYERILSGSANKTIKIWNVQTGDCLHTLEGHTGYVRCIKVLCEGRIISGSEDGEIRI